MNNRGTVLSPIPPGRRLDDDHPENSTEYAHEQQAPFKPTNEIKS